MTRLGSDPRVFDYAGDDWRCMTTDAGRAPALPSIPQPTTNLRVVQAAASGRMRIHSPSLRQAPHVVAALEQSLREQSAVYNVSANALTGNALIHYSRGVSPAELLIWLKTACGRRRRAGEIAAEQLKSALMALAAAT